MRALFFYLFAAVATVGAAGVLVYSDHAPRALRCLLPTLLALAGICVLLDATPGAALLVAASALLMSPAMPLAVRLRAGERANWKTKITPGFQIFVGALLVAACANFAFRVHDFSAANGASAANAAGNDVTGAASPFAPGIPFESVAPGAPIAPIAPITPFAPANPLAPGAPITPGAPIPPIFPGTPGVPLGPIAPIDPVAPADPLAPGAPIDPGAPGTSLIPGGTATASKARRAAGAATGIPAAELLPLLLMSALLLLAGALCLLPLLPQRRTR